MEDAEEDAEAAAAAEEAEAERADPVDNQLLQQLDGEDTPRAAGAGGDPPPAPRGRPRGHATGTRPGAEKRPRAKRRPLRDDDPAKSPPEKKTRAARGAAVHSRRTVFGSAVTLLIDCTRLRSLSFAFCLKVYGPNCVQKENETH